MGCTRQHGTQPQSTKLGRGNGIPRVESQFAAPGQGGIGLQGGGSTGPDAAMHGLIQPTDQHHPVHLARGAKSLSATGLEAP